MLRLALRDEPSPRAQSRESRYLIGQAVLGRGTRR